METSLKADLVKSSGANVTKGLCFVALGLALAAAGIYIGDTDNAPGAAILGILLAMGMVALAGRAVQRKP